MTEIKSPTRPTLPASALAAALACTVLGTASPLALAGTITGPKVLNDTGATQCYVNKVLTSDCASTGQDADFGRDVKKPDDSDGHAGFSFRKVCNTGEFSGTGNCPADPPLGTGPNDWGCTHDKVTKLTWEVKTNDGGLRDGARIYTNYGDGRLGDISEYMGEVNKKGLCGFSDWRIPNVVEIHSLYNYNNKSTAPNIDNTWFPNSVDSHWTSDSVQKYYEAWFIDGGKVKSINSFYLYHATLVRQGITWPKDKKRYIPNETEVYDSATGLTWRNCDEPCGVNGEFGKKYSPAEAFKQAKKVAKDSGLKWRVPNIKEILSIQILTGHSFQLNPDVFFFGGYQSYNDYTYITNTPSFEGDAPGYYASDILMDGNQGYPAHPIHAGSYKLTLVR